MTLRVTSSINRGWLFQPLSRAEAEALRPDERSEAVSLPHPNIVLPAQGFDDQAFQFLSFYRRRLRLPAEAQGNRVLVRFDGVMTAATLSCNGTRLLEHRGGFVPFTCELTDHLRWDEQDEITVEVDSRERADIPPFGGHLDYLSFGGIYRGAELSLVPGVFVADVFVHPRDVLTGDRRVVVDYTLDAAPDTDVDGLEVQVRVLDGDRVVASTTVPAPVPGEKARLLTGEVVVRRLEELELWDVDHPRLYEVQTRLWSRGEVLDAVSTRTGLREAAFTEDGFFLNGRLLSLRGLNRHQTFPHVGGAMPARMQRRDAEVLRKELKCNAVRTSHYPQSPEFLDACDELGLLVFEEMPGWQHIGDAAWQQLACRDVEAMVRRDRNHPSIVLWGVRVNESFDSEDFYRRTNEIAHRLDDTRQTSGVRYFRESQLLEDVFALNDFQTGGLIDPPHHPRYLVSEFAGHMFPTKRFDNVQRVQEHALLHAAVLDAVRGQPGIAGAFGWCAFDYATHAEFGSGNRVCYHGVADMFRVAKPAASVYRAQCPPQEEIVLEPAFAWAGGDHSDYGGPGRGAIFSNCDRIVASVAGERVAELLPDRAGFPHLAHPPFFFGEQSGIAPWRRTWGDLQLEGYLGERRVVTRTFSGRGVDADFTVEVDHDRLLADGADTTRLLVRVTDEHGNDRPLATGCIELDVEGPVTVIGEQPVALVGGTAAVYLRATDESGQVTVSARHTWLGTRSTSVTVEKVEGELW
jgi:beta-galactosidase